METNKTPDEVKKAVRKRLHEALEGRTQQAVSDESGIPKGTLSKYLSGEEMPGAWNLIKFSRATGYSIHYLLTGQEPKKVVQLKAATGEQIEIPNIEEVKVEGVWEFINDLWDAKRLERLERLKERNDAKQKTEQEKTES